MNGSRACTRHAKISPTHYAYLDEDFMTREAYPLNGNAQCLILEQGIFFLRGFALRYGDALQRSVAVLQQSPGDLDATPHGLRMSGDSTTCFHMGCTTIERIQGEPPDRHLANVPRADMPEIMRRLGRDAALAAGFNGFCPDAFLISRASPGVRVSLHQETGQSEAGTPIVAFALGMATAFVFRKHVSSSDARRITLWHGDVVVCEPSRS
jgi:DNA oxidative demethylase